MKKFKMAVLLMGVAVFTAGISSNGYATLDEQKINQLLEMSGDARGLDGTSGQGFGVDDDWTKPPADSGAGTTDTGSQAPANGNPFLKSVLDPSRSIEDAIMLLLTQIAQVLDQAIHEQAKKIEKLNAGETTDAGSAPHKPSMDLETKKLERLVEKRQQFIDVFRQVTEKYSETAKSAIQSMRN